MKLGCFPHKATSIVRSTRSLCQTHSLKSVAQKRAQGWLVRTIVSTGSSISSCVKDVRLWIRLLDGDRDFLGEKYKRAIDTGSHQGYD